MEKILLLLLIAGCKETLDPNPNPCIPHLICGEAVTCCDGRLYPTTCCDANCDDEIGMCGSNNP